MQNLVDIKVPPCSFTFNKYFFFVTELLRDWSNISQENIGNDWASEPRRDIFISESVHLLSHIRKLDT